jgi:diacylglycerol O-acyltransferase
MERMSGLDASFLYFETDSHLMHIGLVAVLDPGDAPGGYTFARMKEALREQLPAIPALLRKPRHVPLDLGHPLWVADESFDIDRHVHRVAIPAPGSADELAELCGHLSGMPLDRSRPLWEMWFVEGLEEERIAVYVKLHHSMVDGVASASVVAQMSGLPATASTVRSTDSRLPSDLELVGRGVLSLLMKPVGIVKILPNTVVGIRRTIKRARQGATMAAPLRAPRLPFNGTITGHRSVAFADLSLEEMKAIKASTGATVNDVLLTVCGGALRSYLADRDLLPSTSAVASIPVSVRETSARAFGSNKVSILFTRLGTHIEDPLERLSYVAVGTRAAKGHSAALGPDVLQDWAEVGSGRLIARALEMFSERRLADRGPAIHNLVVSNIPGPVDQVSFLGARLEAIYPLGPILDGAGLNITVMSHAGRMHVGVIACREQVPDVSALAALIEPEMAALVAATKQDASAASQ